MDFALSQLQRAITDARNSMSSGPQVGLPRVEIDLSHAEAMEKGARVEMDRADEAECELEELGRLVARLRDLFPPPESGSPMEHEWLSAMGSPQDAAAYVEARIRELQSA